MNQEFPLHDVLPTGNHNRQVIFMRCLGVLLVAIVVSGCAQPAAFDARAAVTGIAYNGALGTMVATTERGVVAASRPWQGMETAWEWRTVAGSPLNLGWKSVVRDGGQTDAFYLQPRLEREPWQLLMITRPDRPAVLQPLNETLGSTLLAAVPGHSGQLLRVNGTKVAESHDFGQTWTARPRLAFAPDTIAAYANASLLASQGSRLFMVAPNGSAQMVADLGAKVSSMVVTWNGVTLASGAEGGAFVGFIRKDGRTWTRLTPALPALPGLIHFTFDTQHSHHLFAASGAGNDVHSSSFWESWDTGTTWGPMPN